MDPENSGSVTENSKVARSLKTAPFTGRFPNQRQEKYCWAAYVQFNKCSAAKSEDDEECLRYKHYFRSLCPNEWIETWDAQKEGNIFPGQVQWKHTQSNHH